MQAVSKRLSVKHLAKQLIAKQMANIFNLSTTNRQTINNNLLSADKIYLDWVLTVTCEHGVPGLAQRVEEPHPAARPARRAARALAVAAVGDVGVGLVVVVVVVVVVAVVVVVVDVVGHVDHRVDRLHDEGEKAE